MSRSTFVIVPAFNDERVLQSTLESLLTADYTILVVDDGSKDKTWSITSGLPVHALRHPVNLGQGAALQTGMTYALRHGAEVLVHFDADGQHSIEDIALLVEPIVQQQADIVFGSRFLQRADAEAVPPVKRLLLKGAVVVNGLLTGIWLSDAHNGLRAFSRKAAQEIRLSENGYAHATEILSEMRKKKLRYLERPTHVTYSDYAMKKGQPIWNSINIVIDVLLRKVFR